MTDPARHLRMLRPAKGVLAFYDGRDGHRFARGANWVDDGALSLGIASYAVVSGAAALVYDTHVSRAHAARIKGWLAAEGVRDITVVLSHCHLDHIAGTAEFAGCEVVANARTAAHLARDRAAIEAGSLSGLPAIAPLVLPDRVFSGETVLQIGATEVRLVEANIHSDDATVLWLPESGLLLAGDTVEDTVTYVGDPAAFATHLADLARLAALSPRAILPNHGAEAVIAGGGYGASLIPATADYIRWLTGLRDDPARQDTPLHEAIAAQLASGALTWFAPYERVHAQNIARSLAVLHG
ncbi:MBL fold metallo-hydrolase [Paragemmobacter straminiformis]|uniref:MBL fold metallo-hydrolase n=1 Tax=Paragemmobacter straminiformis TaxID=2045119 RepID=A0A842I8F5_9RHOB|nr:MBL fold metallo-hydrolase [Gemmobacter straminiformis]MBC2835268.1 MBL fold metallo-hydrolase [Gemmobacter straminiformis]